MQIQCSDNFLAQPKNSAAAKKSTLTKASWRQYLVGQVDAILQAPRAGFEPATYPLGGDRAIQLCHRGMLFSVAHPSVNAHYVTVLQSCHDANYLFIRSR